MSSLSEEQQSILFAAKQAYSSPTDNLIQISARSGSGKEQPLSSKILTPTGWSTMGSIQPGSLVIGSDGLPKLVLSTHPQGVKDIYNVSFIDGTVVQCGLEHLWTVRDRQDKSNTLKTISLNEMLSSWIKKEHVDKRYANSNQCTYHYSIPTSSACHFDSHEELIIDPYLLGLLLGDGGFTSTQIGFTNKNKQLVDKVEQLLNLIGYRLHSSFKRGAYQCRITNGSNTIPFKSLIARLGLDNKLSIEKHIPQQYLNASLESRKKLYQGLIDTDGHVRNGMLIEYSTSSEQLSIDFLELGRSIGKQLSIRSRIPKYKYNDELKHGATSYRIRELASKQDFKSIIDISFSHKEEAKCIYIDSEDHLYVTDGYNLTHNTFMLATITKHLSPTTGMYLAYNKSIAEESKDKFPSTIACRTTHSLAYGNIVKNLGLEVGFFSYKNIRERIPYEEKLLVVDIMEKFCLSASTDIHALHKEHYPTKLIDIAQIYIRKMQSKEIACTHSFYLKLYQLSLKAGIIKPKKVDLLMLDEAGDINEVTLSIFQLIQAKLKVLVGDNHQNIYSFNGTINGFNALKGVGQYFELTKSFRVSSFIARAIEQFCKEYLDPDVKFVGIDYRHTDMVPEDHAYISRTNASMIARMIQLDENHIQYNLVRPAKSIFELILILLYLKPGGEIYNAKYRFLQPEADQWEQDVAIRAFYPTLFSYIASVNEGDVEITSAMSLLSRFGKDTIMTTYNNAVRHEKDHKHHKMTLTTAHS